MTPERWVLVIGMTERVLVLAALFFGLSGSMRAFGALAAWQVLALVFGAVCLHGDVVRGRERS